MKRRRRAVDGTALLVVPAVALLVLVLVWPVFQLLKQSLFAPDFTTDKYTGLLDDGVSTTILVRTLVTGAIVTGVTLLLAYPYALAMTRVGPRTRAVMMTIVLLPFWTSLMARTFAWIVLLQDGGTIQTALAKIGLTDVHLQGNLTGVTIGMTQVLLPFMTLPLYNNMHKIDVRLVAAARSLGASGWTAFRKVFFPLSVPGIASGVTIVYIMALGFYVTPQLLGSPQDSMISQQIQVKVYKLLDYGSAGALAALLIVITIVLMGLLGLVTKPSEALSGASGTED